MLREKEKNLILFLNFAILFILFFTYFFFPLYLLDRGFSATQIGIMFMVFTLTGIFSAFNIGIFEDRFGFRKNMAFGYLLLLFFYLSLPYGNSFIVYTLLFFIGGVGLHTLRVSLQAFFLKKLDKQKQTLELGVFNALYQFGMGAGVLCGSLLITRLGYHQVFTVCAILFFVIGIITLQIKSDPLRYYQAHHYLKDIWQPKVILFSLILFIFTLHWGAELTAYSPFLKKHLGLSTKQAGLFMSLPMFSLSLSSYYFGCKSNQYYSSFKLLIIAVVFSGLGMILFAVTQNVILSLVFRLFHGMGDAAFSLFSGVGIARLFSKERLGGNTGFIMWVMIMGQAVGALGFGWLANHYGFAIPHIIAGICSLSTLPFIFYAKNYYHH